MAAVRETLQTVDGVEDVNIDFGSKIATVSVDESKFSSDTAVQKLVDAGYGAEVTSTN